MIRASRGQRRWVPCQRRTPIDISIVATRVPSFPIIRRIDVSEVEKWRQTQKRLGKRVGWNAILAHAFGKVSQQIPELRDVYVARPIAYIYRHPEPIASLTIHRNDNSGIERLIWARIASPQTLGLEELQARVDHFSTTPIEDVFKDGLRLEHRLSPIRRLNWYLLMRWCGRKRAKHLGTFSLSSLGHLGALNLHHPIVTASSIAMGPIDPQGNCDIALICDHRVLDGVLASQALQILYETIRATTAE
ncbi:MAG: hypothetical protein ACKOAU_18160 [Pirellula sp.]